MPTLKSIAAAACVAALLSAPAARADDSKALVELCGQYLALPPLKEGEVTPEFIQLKSSCAGFLNSHVKMSKPEDGYCIPKGYNMDDLARHYMAWIGKNPERAGEPTRVTMSAALAQAYPCGK